MAVAFAIGQGPAFADVSRDQKFDPKKAATETELSDSGAELQKIAETPFDFCSVEAVKAHTLAMTRAAMARTKQILKEGRRPDVQQDIAKAVKDGVDDGAINDTPSVVDEFVSAKKRGDVTAEQELLEKMTPLEHARAAQVLHDWTLAITILTPIADAGDSDAQVALASLYSVAGRAWVRAVPLPPPPGTFPPRVQALFSDFSLPPENETLALKYYKLAAVKGNADAEEGLALAYSCGQGTEKDYARAYAWFSLELAQRAVTIQTNWAPKDILGRRDIIANQMSPEQVQQAKTLLIQCHKSNFQKCD